MKILKMIKAEFIKIFARVSTYVIIVSAVFLVIASLALGKLTEKLYEYDYYSEMVKWEVQSLNDVKSQYDGKNDKYSKLIVEMADYKINGLNEIKYMDITHNDWKNGLQGEYESVRADMLTLSLLKKGYKLADIEKANIDLNEAFYINQEVAINYEIKTKKELEEYEKSLKSKYDELNELLLGDKEYKEALAREIKNDRKIVEENKKAIESNVKLINSKSTSKEEKTNLEKTNKELTLNNEKIEKNIYWKQYMIDNNIKEIDWKHEVIEEILEYYTSSYKSLNVLSEDEYYKSEEYAEYKRQKLNVSYEDYVKISTKINENIENKFKVNEYAILKDIRINSGSRAELERFTVIYSIIAVVTIIIAGTIVAREFSTGSIRMLLIRPVKRWKILTAKLCTVLIFMVILTVILFITSFITTGICYGFNDFTVHDLEIHSGKVVEVPFIISMIKQCSVAMISSVFFVLFAFAISTILRSVAAAIALPIASMLGGQIVQSIFFSMPKAWLSYTPVPYISLSKLTDSYIANGIYELNILHHMNISILNGSLMFLAISAIMMTITYIVFNKIDIKNQ